AVVPGNYSLSGADAHRVGGFSGNLPSEGGLLKRVPVAGVEALFAQGAGVPVSAETKLPQALQGHWSPPVEPRPLLLVLLLLVLALETLLANKFYRREPEAQP